MKVKWSAIGGVYASVFLVAGGIRAQEAEPSSDGKPMSHWLGLLNETPKDPSKPNPEWSRAPMELAKIGVPAVPGLKAALQNASASTRRRAALSLLAMGRKGEPAAADLAKATKDSETAVRQTSAAALGSIGATSSEVVAALVAALKDPEAAVREAAATSLGRLKAVEATPALTEATKDGNGAVRTSAARALRRIAGKDETGPKAAAPGADSQRTLPPSP